MARPRNPNIKRIESDTYKLGYAVEINDEWVIRVSTVKRHTGLRAVDANAQRVKAMIDEVVHQYRRDRESGLRSDPKSVRTYVADQRDIEASAIPSFYVAVERWYAEFITARKANLSKKYPKQVRNQLNMYMPKGGDFPLAPDRETLARLVDRFSRIKATRDLEGSTLRRELGTWKRVFTWMCGMDWIRNNPIDQLSLPEETTRPEEERAFTEEEYQSILAATTHDPEFIRLCRFLRWSGLRIHEAIDMKWEDIHDDTLLIRGKGHKGKKSLRRIPLKRYPDSNHSPVAQWQREIWKVLDEQRDVQTNIGELYKDAVGNAQQRRKLSKLKIARSRGRIWRWNDDTHPRRMLRIARGIEEGDADGVAFHAFRGMAEHYLLHTLHLPKDYVMGAIGHSAAVHDKHYKMAAKASEVVAMLDRFAGA